MAFGKFEDETGSIDFVAFPSIFKEYQELLKSDVVVLMKAKVDVREEELNLVAEKFTVPSEMALNHSASASHHEIFIPRKTNKDTLAKVGQLLKAHPGDESVAVIIPNGSSPQRMILPYGVAWSEKLEKEVQDLLA